MADKFAQQHQPLPFNFTVHLVRTGSGNTGEMLSCVLANNEETVMERDDCDGENVTSPDSKRARHA